MALSLALRTSLLQIIANNPFSTSLFVSLHTADEATVDASNGTAGALSAARQSAAMSVPASRETHNTAVISFPAMSSASTVKTYGLWSASSGGTYYGSVSVSAGTGDIVAAGQIYRIPIGVLSLSFSTTT